MDRGVILLLLGFSAFAAGGYVATHLSMLERLFEKRNTGRIF